MAQKNYYILLDKKGDMIITDCKLPFYWDKTVAQSEAFHYDAILKPVKIEEIKRLFERKRNNS